MINKESELYFICVNHLPKLLTRYKRKIWNEFVKDCRWLLGGLRTMTLLLRSDYYLQNSLNLYL